MDEILAGLNPQQREAVLQIERPLLVLAGAGSGKTRVITHKIAYLIKQGYNPQNILALTFTKKAANEMKERVINMLGVDYGAFPTFIGTFHSFGARILRRYARAAGLEPSFTIYDEQDQLNLVKTILKRMNPQLSVTPGVVHAHIKKNKTAGISPRQLLEEIGSDPFEELVYNVYKEYQATLKSLNAVDFTDLLTILLDMLKNNESLRQTLSSHFKYVLVDEYQDTNPPQYQIVYLLTKDHRRLCVVGDEDQSIYSWRGATVENIRRFQRDYPDHVLIKLEQNYRSTQIILDAANSVISKNPNRIEKNLWTENKQNIPIKIVATDDQQTQALYVAQKLSEYKENLNDVAILYRVNAQSRLIEETLLKLGIPYRLVGGVRFYERLEIKDMLAYLKFLDNPRDEVSLLRIINTPSRGIGPKALENLREYAKQLQMPFSVVVYLLSLAYDAESPKALELLERWVNQDVAQELKEAVKQFRKYHNLFKVFNKLILIKEGDLVTPAQLLQQILRVTKYSEWIKRLSTNDDEYESRMQNIMELINLAKSKPYSGKESITMFLEDIALVEESKEVEDSTGTARGKVNLMTIHASKGLEFDTVFIIDAVEGYIPHQRSFDSPIQMQEERRLFYVAVTRTKRHLYIIYPANVWAGGVLQPAQVSRYVSDIPSNLVEYEVS